MAEEGKKPKPNPIWEFFDKYAKHALAVSSVVHLLSFATEDRLASYVSLAVGYVLVFELLWRVITQKSPVQRAVNLVLPSSVSSQAKLRYQYSKTQRRWAKVGLVGVTLIAFGWGGYNVRQDLAPPIRPAKDGETLIVLSQFEYKGSGEHENVFAQLIHDDLEAAHKEANIEGIRVKILPEGIIKSPKEAKELGDDTNATLVIWGWFNAKFIAPFYLICKDPEPIMQPDLDRFLIPSKEQSDECAFLLDTEVPQSLVYLTEFTIGQVFYLDGQYEKALPHFDAALDSLKEMGILSEEASSWGEEYVYFYRGIAHDKLGLSNFAMMDYREAIKRNDRFAEAYNNLGVGFSALGLEDLAIQNFSDAIWWGSPGVDGVAYYNRGNVYYQRGDFEQAKLDYSRAIARLEADNKSVALYNRGLAYAQNGKHQKAIDDYTDAIELVPKNPVLYLERARSYCKLCEYELARDDLSQVIEELETDQETRVEALTKRGVTYTRLGQYSEALQDYQEALSLGPEYALAHYNFAANKALEGDAEGAIEALLKAMELNPKFKASAACDNDFDGIRDHAQMPKLVPPTEGCPPDPCQ